jgi:hypothetical protein
MLEIPDDVLKDEDRGLLLIGGRGTQMAQEETNCYTLDPNNECLIVQVPRQ